MYGRLYNGNKELGSGSQIEIRLNKHTITHELKHIAPYISFLILAYSYWKTELFKGPPRQKIQVRNHDNEHQSLSPEHGPEECCRRKCPFTPTTRMSKSLRKLSTQLSFFSARSVLSISMKLDVVLFVWSIAIL